MTPYMFCHLLQEPVSDPRWSQFFDHVIDHYNDDNLTDNERGIVDLLVDHYSGARKRQPLAIAYGVAGTIAAAISLSFSHYGAR
jgi:hypothetical protein